MKSVINSYLQELAQKVNLPLALNEKGQCYLNHSSGLDCIIEVPDNQSILFLYSPVMPLPTNYNKELLFQVLSLNLHQIITHGTTLAIDPSTHYFVLCFSKPIESLNFASFENILGNFLETASSIKTQLLELMNTNLE
ncbi:MAG: hypothetical protein A2007_00070 [Verrucomicrobia bacterium GWC2_42_7]|nr:MAG: hypothetical protein A2007_00070 [Verrucomicrobia bacterium GWC2_42_7]